MQQGRCHRTKVDFGKAVKVEIRCLAIEVSNLDSDNLDWSIRRKASSNLDTLDADLPEADWLDAVVLRESSHRWDVGSREVPSVERLDQRKVASDRSFPLYFR